MKARIVIILIATCLAAGCTHQLLPNPTLEAAESTAEPTATATVTTTLSPMPLTTSLPPTAAPKVIVAGDPSTLKTDETAMKAMKRDIERLVANSQEQQGQEENYKNLKKEQCLAVERVTGKDLKFSGKPQVFAGDYTGQLTKGKKYKYFEDASMGGKRYYNVKDNFGVWIIFQYQDPSFK